MSGQPARNPAAHSAWMDRWERDHSGRWRHRGSKLVLPTPTHPVPPLRPCRDTILELERELNDGAQLSEVAK